MIFGMTDNNKDGSLTLMGTISQKYFKIYVLVIWQSNVQGLANMAVIIMGSIHGDMPPVQYHSSHDRLDFPHQGGK